MGVEVKRHQRRNRHATGTHQPIAGGTADETEKGRETAKSHRLYPTERIVCLAIISSLSSNRRNGIHRFAFLLADNFCINLRDTDTGVPQQLADGVQLGPIGQAEGGEGVPGYMEGDVLANTGGPRPLLQQLAGVGSIGQVSEHLVFGSAG